MAKQEQDIKTHIDNLVKNHKVIVFGKSWDMPTRNAIEAISKCGATSFFFDLEMEKRSKDFCTQYQAALGKMTNNKETVPKVFVNGEYVQDAMAQLESGQLAQRLAGFIECNRGDSAIKVNIQNLLKQHKVIVFGKQKCQFTQKALDVFGMALKKGEYKFYDIEAEADVKGQTKKYLKVLGQMTRDGETVPKVFINSQYIGGGDVTRNAYEEGTIEPKLKACGFTPKAYDGIKAPVKPDGYGGRNMDSLPKKKTSNSGYKSPGRAKVRG